MSSEPSPHSPRRPLGRRSVLRLAAAGGLVTAGGAVLATLGFRTANGGSPVPGFHPGLGTGSSRTPSAGRRPTWSQSFQPHHGWSAGGSGTASADLNDTAVFDQGTQSVRVTTRGTGAQSYVRKVGMPAMDLTGKMVRLVFRVDSTAHLHTMGFYLGSRGFEDNFSWLFHTHSANPANANYVQSGEWVTVQLEWADLNSAAGAYTISSSGVPSVRSGFTDMSFAVYDDAGGPVTYHLQAVELLPDTSTVFPHGVVSITFDDSYASVHDFARPAMDAHGFHGTVYNIAQAIGTRDFLTLDQMRSLQNSSGWEMAGHAYATAAHASGYNQLTSQQVDRDLKSLREWLVANRFTSENFAYPHGAFQQTSDGVPVDRIASRHFSTARSIVSETIESITPAMPYRLKALTGLNDGKGTTGETMSSVTGLGGKLDRCANNGDWLILCFHQLISASPTMSTQISHAGFASVMEAIAERGIPVVTVAKAMTYYS